MDNDPRSRTRPHRNLKKLNCPRLPKKYLILRGATILALIIFSLPSVTTLSARGQTYNLKYDLGYIGVPLAGGDISLVSNFTNTGQLTLQVTSLSLASDFWSNGTRQVTSGFPLNLTTGMNKMINTAVFIPPNAFMGNHNVTATAAWQYSNSSGWFNASPVAVSKTVLVSQTIGSLFSSFATILLIGLGIAGVVVVLVVFLVTRRGKKSKSSTSLPAGPGPI
jgi:hypothetical protein